MAKLEALPSTTIRADQGSAVGLELPLFQKLKPGPGLAADAVIADQRRRLHGAMIATVDQHGLRGVRVRSLARAAGVSTATFYKHFLNADDCLASTYDEVMTVALRSSATEQRRRSDWRDSLRSSISALMKEFAAEPRGTRLVLLDVFSGGPTARRRIGHAVSDLEQLVAAGYAPAPKAMTPPRHLIAGMAAGIIRIARLTTLTDRIDELPDLAEEVSDWMLTLSNSAVHTLSVTQSDPFLPSRRESRPSLSDPECSTEGVGYEDRTRILRAVVKTATERGYSQLSTSGLRADAGVSRRRFDAHFVSLEECFLAAVQMLVDSAATRSLFWSDDERDWQRRTCRYVLALCAQAARNRRHARLTFLGVFAAGRAGLLLREQMIGHAAERLRATVPAEFKPSRVSADASVAAVWSIAQADIAAGRARSLPKVAPFLSYVLLAPIIGAVAASGVAVATSR